MATTTATASSATQQQGTISSQEEQAILQLANALSRDDRTSAIIQVYQDGLKSLTPKIQNKLEDMALNDPDTDVKGCTLEVLKNLSDEADDPFLFESVFHRILTDQNPASTPKHYSSNRIDTINYIGYLCTVDTNGADHFTQPSKKYEEGLIKSADPNYNASPKVRLAAIENMGNIIAAAPSNYTELDQAVKDALKDSDPDVFSAAQDASLYIGTPPIKITRPFVEYNSTTEKILIAQSTNVAARIRKEAAKEMRKSGSKKNWNAFQKPLKELLAREDQQAVQSAAINTMARLSIRNKKFNTFDQDIQNVIKKGDPQYSDLVRLTAMAAIVNLYETEQNAARTLTPPLSTIKRDTLLHAADYNSEKDPHTRIGAIHAMERILNVNKSYTGFTNALNSIAIGDPDQSVQQLALALSIRAAQNASIPSSSQPNITPAFTEKTIQGAQFIFDVYSVIGTDSDALSLSDSKAIEAAKNKLNDALTNGTPIELTAEFNTGDHNYQKGMIVKLTVSNEQDVDNIINDIQAGNVTTFEEATQTGETTFEVG